MLLKSAEVWPEEVRSGSCPQKRKLLPKEEPSPTISSIDCCLAATYCGQWGGRDSNPQGVLPQRILSPQRLPFRHRPFHSKRPIALAIGHQVEATAGFEPAIEVLQTPALPLGYVAPRIATHSLAPPTFIIYSAPPRCQANASSACTTCSNCRTSANSTASKGSRMPMER